MKIVLIGDLHFFRLVLWPWQLVGKRFLGQFNLWFNRRTRFVMDRIDPVIERVGEIRPDLLLFSGDLTTTAMRSEFRLAHHRLRPLLEKFPAVIVPGNHDRYSVSAMRTRRLERVFAGHTVDHYPHHRQLEAGLHLIALDPTRANIVTDRGRLGPRQLQELRVMLDGLPADARLIIMCHYTLGTPPNSRPEAPLHALIDLEPFKDVLRGPRQTLVVHGHVHVPYCWRLPDVPNVIAANAGAPLMHDARWPNGQGFWEIETDASGWRFTHHHQACDGSWHSQAVSPPIDAGAAHTFA